MHVEPGDADPGRFQRRDRIAEFAIVGAEPESTAVGAHGAFARNPRLEVPVDSQPHSQDRVRSLGGQFGGPTHFSFGVQIDERPFAQRFAQAVAALDRSVEHDLLGCVTHCECQTIFEIRDDFGPDSALLHER